MKIDLDWIQEELDAGREVELECVDRDGFLAGSCFENTEILRRDLIIESVFFGRVDIASCDYSIVESEFKHFRIKRNEPTFDDLIGVAVQAVKDKVIHKAKLINMNGDVALHWKSSIESKKDEVLTKDSWRKFDSVISYINSLYTETFVIENFQDTKKLKSGAKVLLSNGEEVVFSNRTGVDDSLWFKYNRCYSAIIPYIALKGATVTQRKGDK